MGKSQLLFVIEDLKGNKFGCFLSTQIEPNIYDKDKPTNTSTFLFSLKSNERLNQMMKFEIIKTEAGYNLTSKTSIILISFGYFGITLYKQNCKHNSFCTNDSSRFNYHGKSSALCGSSNFIPKRFVVIQMK